MSSHLALYLQFYTNIFELDTYTEGLIKVYLCIAVLCFRETCYCSFEVSSLPSLARALRTIKITTTAIPLRIPIMAKTRALQTAFLALSGSPFEAYSFPCIYENSNKPTAEHQENIIYTYVGAVFYLQC